eukprot:1143372-Pelagomonas_calceolata.AAC.7
MERRPACSVQKASLGLTPVHPFDFLFQLPRAGMHLLASCDALATNVDGAIQVKSYLTGNPPIKIKLNDDLIIGVCVCAFPPFSQS